MVEKATVTRLLPVDTWVKRQIDTLKSVGQENYAVGITTPKRDPIEAGIEAEQKYAAALKIAIEKERRKKGLERTNMDEWYTYATTIGKANLVDGVVLREKKVKRFVQAFQPVLMEHLRKIDEMEDVTLRQRLDKMIANVEGLVALKDVV